MAGGIAPPEKRSNSQETGSSQHYRARDRSLEQFDVDLELAGCGRLRIFPQRRDKPDLYQAKQFYCIGKILRETSIGWILLVVFTE